MKQPVLAHLFAADCPGAAHQCGGGRAYDETAPVQVCPRDYVPALLKWIDAENLPTYLGGKSKATLLDDSGPWNDPALVAQIETELKAVRANMCTYVCELGPKTLCPC